MPAIRESAELLSRQLTVNKSVEKSLDAAGRGPAPRWRATISRRRATCDKWFTANVLKRSSSEKELQSDYTSGGLLRSVVILLKPALLLKMELTGLPNCGIF